MELKKTPLSLESRYGNVFLKRNIHCTPEVYAENEAALYFGEGFVHMNDRQLQAYMLKIIFSARVAEQLNPSLVAVDEYIRSFPFCPEPEKELSKLSSQAKENLQAFCDGCNAWFEQNRPRWEWKLVGFKPDRWHPADVLAIANAFGFVGLTDSHLVAKKMVIQFMQNGISEEKIKSLFPGIKGKIDYGLISKLKIGPNLVPTQIKWLVPSFTASNNWVVGPRKAGGTVLFANDPHLQIDRLPAIWQEIVLSLSGKRFLGFSIPGIPGPIAGRTAELAWGLTYSFMDMLEYRIEEIKDGSYRRGEEWIPLVKRTEEIRVKKKKPITKHYWETDHGLLEGYNEHNLANGFYLCLHYSAAKNTGAAELSAAFELYHCKTVKQGMEKIRQMESPSFNWLLADREGNIGYQMSGRAIDRGEESDGIIPLPAWDRKPITWLSSKDLPSVWNPEEGFIVTANEEMTRFSSHKVQTIPLASYRVDRITALLKEKDILDIEDMKKIQLDLYSLQAKLFMQQAKPYLEKLENGRCLADWDFCYDAESAGATYFERYYRKLLELVFCSKQLGIEVFDYLWKETAVFNLLFGFFDNVLLQEETPWFTKQEKAECIQSALEYSLSAGPVKMKDDRRVVMKHIFFGNILPSFLGFDYGPVFFAGSRATVNQGQFFRNLGMDTSFCPSFRLVADMQDDAIYTNYIGGVSDRRFSRLYLSDIENYLNGVYRETR